MSARTAATGSNSAARVAEAERALAAGRPDQAVALAEALIDSEPLNARALYWFGELLMRTGRSDEALASYERAAALVPGDAAPFTRLATIRFRRAYGAPPAPRPPIDGPRIQGQLLGADGRFGNQLLQYGFLRLCARRYGLGLEVPDWIGRDLYDLDDPLPGPPLAERREEDLDLAGALAGDSAHQVANCNIRGYFCGSMARWGEVAQEFRALYQPGARVTAHVALALDRLRSRGETIIAVHLRRGDFGYGRFWVAPSSWYSAWLDTIWPLLDRPILYVASDSEAVARELAQFSPVTAADLGVEIVGAPFLIDFEVLRNADMVAVSNSTFSYAAALLNVRASVFMRPDPDARRLRPLVPWKEPVLLDPAGPFDGLLTPPQEAYINWAAPPGSIALRIGELCGPVAHAFRSRYPSVTLVELPPEASVDEWRSQQLRPHVDLLILANGAELARLASSSARRSLELARIDRILVPAKESTASGVAALSELGYVWRAASAAGMSSAQAAPIAGAPYQLAEHRRLAALVEGRREDLDVIELCRRHEIEVDAVVHVGAHEGQELDKYERLGARRVVMVEANPQVYARLAARLADRPGVQCIQAAVGAEAGRARLHLASFDQSSSLLPMEYHRAVYPGIVPAGSVEVNVVTLDHLLEQLELEPTRLSLLSIDVQGAEMLVLKGAERALAHVRGVLVEVSFVPLYRGGAQIEEVEDWLRARGFRRVALASAWHPTWADAFYVRS